MFSLTLPNNINFQGISSAATSFRTLQWVLDPILPPPVCSLHSFLGSFSLRENVEETKNEVNKKEEDEERSLKDEEYNLFDEYMLKLEEFD